ncbi:MAG: helix-turn-helix domain-containing protein [Candidatus Delongbacteria bacterium]|nr:helix-turn-helix domain-containing protein [Candidatus Delongbacteria bacterium]
MGGIVIKNLTELTKKKFIVVNIANEIGISKTAELFNYSRQTIRIWKKEYRENGIEGLQNKSRKGQSYPDKVSYDVVNKIIAIKVNHPDYTAKKIKKVLKLNYSIRTISKKINQNSHLLKIDKKNNQTNNLQPDVFSDFFVSIKKIQYNNRPNKLPKYIILLEERSTGITFSSFSYERISLSIAIFLEYIIENLQKFFSFNKFNFYLSSSIKMSSNDIITHIVKDKFQYNLIPNSYISEFYSSSIRDKPYSYLYDNLFSKFNFISNNENSLSYKTFAHLFLFNHKRIEHISNSKIPVDSSLIEKFGKISFIVLPIFTDKFISSIDRIKRNKKFFNDLYSNISNPEFNLRLQQINLIISYLATIGKKAEVKYQHQLAEEIFSATESIAKYYIDNISEYLEQNNSENNPLFSDHTLILNNIVSNLIASLSGLSYSFKLKGFNQKEISYLEESIELSEKYDFIENEIILKNMLVFCYTPYQDKDKALELVRYIIKHPQINKEQDLIAKINIGMYYFEKSNFKIAENIYVALLEKIGKQYPELRTIVLLNLSTIDLFTNRLSEAFSYLEEAKECIKANNILKYGINLNDNFGLYYAKNQMSEKAIEYFKKAIKLSKKRGNVVFINRSTRNLGNIYNILGKYDKAIISFKSILLSIQESQEYKGLITLLLYISGTYFNLKKYKISENYAEKAIFLSNVLKNDLLYFCSLIYMINIHIEQLDIKKIVAILQIFINMKDKIKNSSTKFIIKIITYKSEFLKLLFNHKLTKKEILLREEKIIDIFNEIDSDIEYYKDNNDQKAELTFLYCKLYKYLYDHSKKQKIKIEMIEGIIKDSYILHKKNATEIYTTLSSQAEDVLYKKRLKEIEQFPEL